MSLVLTGCNSDTQLKIEKPNVEKRVDKVDKLLNEFQIKNYILKYQNELDIEKKIQEVNNLIEEGNSNCDLEGGTQLVFGAWASVNRALASFGYSIEQSDELAYAIQKGVISVD